MDEMSKHGHVGRASLRAGMHRNTARRYLKEGKIPSELRSPRSWRTREDPFAEDWPAIAERLESAPELEAKALFEHLLLERPGRYQEGQMRTFQRRVKQWRAEFGPPKEIFLPQEHRPGEISRTQTTDTDTRSRCGGPESNLLHSSRIFTRVGQDDTQERLFSFSCNQLIGFRGLSNRKAVADERGYIQLAVC